MKTINYSELARQIGLSPESFRKKRKRINYNKFSNSELIGIEYVLTSDVEAFLAELRRET